MIESQWLGPLLAGIIGAIAANVAHTHGSPPDSDSLALTVDQARSSFMAILGILFTGLSIVLALAALVAGNIISRFSPRLIRLMVRSQGQKSVLGVFSLTASFIVTTQILLRNSPGDELAPPTALAVAVGLLVVSGVMIIWYINATMQSIRVDRNIRWIGRRVKRAAELTRRIRTKDDPEVGHRPERPITAVDVVADDSGYIVDVDLAALERRAKAHGLTVALDAPIGRPVTEGERIGWVHASEGGAGPHRSALSRAVVEGSAPDASVDIGYDIGILVDVALMALSPGVNDPKTAVDCIEELVIVFSDLTRYRLGPRCRSAADGSWKVVVIDRSLADHLDLATRQILRYGAGDPTVTSALVRLVRLTAERAEGETAGDPIFTALLDATVEADDRATLATT